MIRILLKIIKALKKINIQAEEVKIMLSESVECLFDIANFDDGNDFELKRTRTDHEELCMDLWEK